jgi:uncharacterized protein (TIGR02246 family)
MDRAGVEAWMEGFRRAWVANDPDQVEALFTQDAVYVFDAFQPAWTGRDEIVRRWTAGISQEVQMDADVWAVDDDLALVHWDVTTRNHGDPVAVQYDGVIVLRFDGDRCRELREWFFRRETR